MRTRRPGSSLPGPAPAALRCTCEAVGASQILLGTDCPYLLGEKFKRCVTYVQESGLPAADVEAILDRNAQALLKLPASVR